MRRTLICAALAVALGSGTAAAVSQQAMQEAAWNRANAQRTAAHHVQLAIDSVEVVDATASPAPCIIHGRIARTFRGDLAVGTGIELRDRCLLSKGALMGGVVLAFLYDRLKESSYMEVYLDAKDGALAIPGGAGWIIEEPSAAPQHPAPDKMPPRPGGSSGLIGTGKGAISDILKGPAGRKD